MEALMPATMRRTSSRDSGGDQMKRPLVFAALCAAFIAGTLAPAHAQRVTDTDAVGDMVKYDWDADGYVPVPDRRLNDVTNTKLVHDVNRVKIRVDFLACGRRPGAAA